MGSKTLEKRADKRPDNREFVSRAQSLKNQIKNLKLHFENEIKNCQDERMERLYVASAKTLDDMEQKLLEVQIGEDGVSWQENAYVFLV